MSPDYVLQRGAFDQSAATCHDWGSLAILSEEISTGVPGVTVGVARILPGRANPLHVHGNCSEIVVLLGGAVKHIVGDETVEMAAGDVLIVPAGVPHRAHSVGASAAEMIVVYNAGERHFRAVEPD